MELKVATFETTLNLFGWWVMFSGQFLGAQFAENAVASFTIAIIRVSQNLFAATDIMTRKCAKRSEETRRIRRETWLCSRYTNSCRKQIYPPICPAPIRNHLGIEPRIQPNENKERTKKGALLFCNLNVPIGTGTLKNNKIGMKEHFIRVLRAELNENDQGTCYRNAAIIDRSTHLQIIYTTSNLSKTFGNYLKHRTQQLRTFSRWGWKMINFIGKNNFLISR